MDPRAPEESTRSAHVAQGEERERIYADLVRQSRSTELYAKMCAPRELPLVVLRG